MLLRFADLLTTHVRFEERDLFDQAETLVGADALAEILRRPPVPEPASPAWLRRPHPLPRFHSLPLVTPASASARPAWFGQGRTTSAIGSEKIVQITPKRCRPESLATGLLRKTL